MSCRGSARDLRGDFLMGGATRLGGGACQFWEEEEEGEREGRREEVVLGTVVVGGVMVKRWGRGGQSHRAI